MKKSFETQGQLLFIMKLQNSWPVRDVTYFASFLFVVCTLSVDNTNKLKHFFFFRSNVKYLKINLVLFVSHPLSTMHYKYKYQTVL